MLSIARLRYRIAKTPLRALVVCLRHRGLDPNDVYLAAYPRSGSTWLKFMLFELLSGEAAGFRNSSAAIPHVGSHHAARPLLPGGHRLIKTHEPYREVYNKAVYLVRDVRDVVLSEFSHWKWLGVGTADLDSFLVQFLQGRSHGYGFGSWDNHVNSWLDGSTVPGREILVVKYEDIRQHTVETLSKITGFLDVQADRQVIGAAASGNTIDQMREKEDRVRDTLFADKRYLEGVRFVGKGRAGGWRERLNEDQLRLIRQFTQDTLVRLGYSTSV
jgi:hypothetical protein